MIFKPFEDDSASVSIEDMTFENQSDCINIYGNLQIGKDQQGLKIAKELLEFAQALVSGLEQTDPLPEKRTIQTEGEIDNPFL